MDLIRHLTLLTLQYNIYVRALHIPGKRNEIADSVSRFQLQRFRHLAPQADTNPCAIPEVINVFDLTADIQHYLNLSAASTTKQTYGAGERNFLNFISYFKLASVEQYLPATEVLLTEYVAYLAKTIKYTSIKTYVSCCSPPLPHIRHGFDLNLQKMLRLRLTTCSTRH